MLQIAKGSMMKRLLVVTGMVFLLAASSAPAEAGDPLPELTSPSEGATVDASYSNVILYYTCPTFGWFSASLGGYRGGGPDRYFAAVSLSATRDGAKNFTAPTTYLAATTTSSGCASALSTTGLDAGATYYWSAYRSIDDANTAAEASDSVWSFKIPTATSPSLPAATSSTPATAITTGAAVTTTPAATVPTATTLGLVKVGLGKWSKKSRKLFFTITGTGTFSFTATIRYKGKTLKFPKWSTKIAGSERVDLTAPKKILAALRKLKKVTATITVQSSTGKQRIKVVLKR